MNSNVSQIWVYLSSTPLLWLSATLAVYQAASWLHRRSGNHPLVNPVLIAIMVLVIILWGTGTGYQTYFDGAQFVHFLLGPATVALAIPLYLYTDRLRRLLVPLLLTLVIGSATAIISTALIGRALGLNDITLRSMLPRSVTTPIAMGIAEQIGGLPSLTAVLVILTGIIGSISAQGVLRLLRIDDDSIRGVAIGVASHGIGTARAFQLGEQVGAFSGLAMGLNGAITTILVPPLVWLLNL